MPEETVTIGLSIGGRYVGVAVLKRTDLKDFRIKTVRAQDEQDRLSQLRTILTELFEKHRPNRVALKVVHESVGSPFQSGRIDLVRKLAEEQGLSVKKYDVEALKNQTSESGLRSKREMAELLASSYPVLRHALPHLGDPAKFYYFKLFEAIAAARVGAIES